MAELVVTKPPRAIHWRELGKIAATVLGFVGISLGVTYLFLTIATRLRLPLYEVAVWAYLTVFLSSFISNLTILTPVPLALAVMMAACEEWNPGVVALVAAAGSTTGELGGYFSGYFGRKVAIPDSIACSVNKLMCKNQIERWIQRYGVWAIFFLAAQPVLPFDIGGLIAGAARMPLSRFLPALLAGRIPKYLTLAYAGAGIMSQIPFLTIK